MSYGTDVQATQRVVAPPALTQLWTAGRLQIPFATKNARTDASSKRRHAASGWLSYVIRTPPTLPLLTLLLSANSPRPSFVVVFLVAVWSTNVDALQATFGVRKMWRFSQLWS